MHPILPSFVQLLCAPKARPSSIALAAVGLVASITLAACGGGGGGDSSSAGTSTDLATAAVANATVLSGDAASALDTSVQTAQAVVATHAGAGATATQVQALSVASAAQPQAVADVVVSCPGGGSATLTITGGMVASVLNGQLDTGEVYQLVFNSCRSAAGAAAVNGSLALTVSSATPSSQALALQTSQLGVTGSNGTIALTGSSTYQRSSTTNSDGTVTLSSQITVPSSTLAGTYNGRSSSYTLSNASWSRQSVWLNGVEQSSSFNGTHTLTTSLSNGSYSYTVATQGSVSYSASGQPVSGAWTITLPNALLAVALGQAMASITLDEGKNGSIDRNYSVSWASLQGATG